MEQIIQAITLIAKNLFKVDVVPELTRPNEQFGDYTTNVAMQLAAQTHANPQEIAKQLVTELQEKLKDQINEATIAGPGFVNIRMNDDFLLEQMKDQAVTQSLAGKVYVSEYSDPNPFKVLHAGHLYTSVVGDAISNLLETAGAEVHRVNFGGDVGLHVATAMWAILKALDGEKIEGLAAIAKAQRADWLAAAYVKGTAAYEENPATKAEIIAINKRVYQLHANNDYDSAFARIYWECRQWSYDYFDDFYKRIGVRFEKYYPESVTAPLGIKTVKAQLAKGVFTESKGAVVFDGEKYGLHTRVFITSEGLPTYETKDVGLILKKFEDYHFDASVIITSNEIVEYMKVVLKAIEQFAPELVRATTHITHGNVKLAGGKKMSSRKGNILRAVDVLDATSAATQAMAGKTSNEVVLAAVKYAFLKQRVGADIIYDPKESVALIGNSGPYLQYAYARARNILTKASAAAPELPKKGALQPDERSLARKIGEYKEVVTRAIDELLPHQVCTYLYELAQIFNHFYEHQRVVGDRREALRLELVEAYSQTLKSGLGLLGIEAPEKM